MFRNVIHPQVPQQYNTGKEQPVFIRFMQVGYLNY